MRGTAYSIECARSGSCCLADANLFPVFRIVASVFLAALRPPTLRTPWLFERSVCFTYGLAGPHPALLILCAGAPPPCAASARPRLAPLFSNNQALGSATVWLGLSDYINAHRSRSSRDRFERRLERVSVQVWHLELGDVLDLLLRHRADLGLVGFVRAFREVRGTLQQHRRRRRLGDEGVRPIRIDRDDDRDDQPFILRSLRVEVLAEVHDIDAVRTERGTDRWRRGGFPRRDLKL